MNWELEAGIGMRGSRPICGPGGPEDEMTRGVGDGEGMREVGRDEGPRTNRVWNWYWKCCCGCERDWGAGSATRSSSWGGSREACACM